jgi:Zn-dependent peptidase ImmA (M78 family)
MPTASLKPRWEQRAEATGLKAWLSRAVEEYDVSAQALYYRLINLGWLTRTQRDSVTKEELYGLEKKKAENPALPLSPAFMIYLGRVIEEGHVSVRKVCDLLRMDLETVRGLFEAHEMRTPFDL